MQTLVDLYDGLLVYDGKDIVILIDDENEPWFYAKQIMDILGYGDTSTRSTMREHVDDLNKIAYSSIKHFPSTNTMCKTMRFS